MFYQVKRCCQRTQLQLLIQQHRQAPLEQRSGHGSAMGNLEELR